jgi:hypothetical protein
MDPIARWPGQESSSSDIGKPIGAWIVPGILVGVVGGLHAVLIAVDSVNLWRYIQSPANSTFSFTHISSLLAINSAGFVSGVIAFFAWARHSWKRATLLTLVPLALFAVAYGIHLGFLYS